MEERTAEQRLEELRKAMMDHQKKMQEDEAYRKRCTEIREKLDKFLPNFGKDTE